MTRRFQQIGLRAFLLAILTTAIMCLVVFPLWVGYAVRSVNLEEERWYHQRDAAPPGYEPPPGWHLDRYRRVRYDKPREGSK